MKKFNSVCAQGDVYIKRINKLPNGTTPEAKSTRVVVAHSETGHHHDMDGDCVTMHRLPDSIMDCFLVVEKPTALEHHRPTDTHESIMFEPGIYHVRRQREHTPEGWRRVED